MRKTAELSGAGLGLFGGAAVTLLDRLNPNVLDQTLWYLLAGCAALVLLCTTLLLWPSASKAQAKAIVGQAGHNVASTGSSGPTIGVQAGRDLNSNIYVGGDPPETQRPEIEAVSCPENNYARIKVSNRGTRANFRATAQEVQNGLPTGSAWPLKWRGSPGEEQSIYKDGEHILDVASIERDRIAPIFVIGVDEEESDTAVVVNFHTAPQYVRGSVKPVEEFRASEDPIMILQIVITSDPPMIIPYKVLWKLSRDEGQWGRIPPSLDLEEVK